MNAVRSPFQGGLWLALDQCRLDPTTLEPVEGMLVDADADLARLCERLREAGKRACSITFCDDDGFVASVLAHQEHVAAVAAHG